MPQIYPVQTNTASSSSTLYLLVYISAETRSSSEVLLCFSTHTQTQASRQDLFHTQFFSAAPLRPLRQTTITAPPSLGSLLTAVIRIFLSGFLLFPHGFLSSHFPLERKLHAMACERPHQPCPSSHLISHCSPQAHHTAAARAFVTHTLSSFLPEHRQILTPLPETYHP